MHLSQTTNSNLWKLETSISTGIHLAVCDGCCDIVYIITWERRADSQAAESATGRWPFGGSLVAENNLIQSHAFFLDRLHPANDCPRTIKPWPSCLSCGQLWRINWSLDFQIFLQGWLKYSIQTHCTLTSFSAPFYLLPSRSPVEDPKNML